MQFEIFKPKIFFELLSPSGFQPSHGTSLQLGYLYPYMVGQDKSQKNRLLKVVTRKALLLEERFKLGVVPLS